MSATPDIEDFQPVPRSIRRAYSRSRKTPHDPLAIPVEGPAPGALATVDDIAAMAVVALDDLTAPAPPAASLAPLPPQAPLNPARHKRLCAVCKHPHRDAIEEAFLQWRNVIWIVDEFSLPDRASVYRHAHAFGLFPRRKANLRFALEHIIEEAERVRPGASGIVEAVRAYAHIDDSGRWIESPTTHIVVPGAAPRRASRRISNRNTPGDRK